MRVKHLIHNNGYSDAFEVSWRTVNASAATVGKIAASGACPITHTRIILVSHAVTHQSHLSFLLYSQTGLVVPSSSWFV